MLYLVMFSSFTFFVLTINLLIHFLNRKQHRLEARLKEILGKHNKTTSNLVPLVKTRKISKLLSKVSFIGSMIGKRYRFKVQDSLNKAGVPMKAEEVVTLNILVTVIVGVIGFITLKKLVFSLIFAFLGFFIPILWVNYFKTRRTIKIERQLLDLTILLANSLRAGHSFLQALELAAKETPQPLSAELSKVTREIRLGSTMEEALEELSNRVESKEMELLVTGVMIQRQIGGNLAEVLDSITETIEKRIKMRGKIKTLTAQGKLSAWILSLLPLALAAFIFGGHPEFSHIMLEEPMGNLMLASGVILLVIGVLTIRKVVNIDV